MRYIPLLKDTHCQDEEDRVWAGQALEPSACFTEPSCSNAEHPPPLHLQCFPFPPVLAADSPDSANPELAGIISFIFNHLKILQCVTIGNEQQELEALQPGNIPGWQFLITSLWVRIPCALFLCPVLGLLPLACSLSPYPRTHLHAHTLIPMCISTPSHNSHTHLYMLMHTRAYTYSFTHMYIHVHTWPHNSSFHGAPYLSRSWGQGKRSALFIRKASRDCSPFSTLSMYLKVLLLNGFLQFHFITAATNIMSTYYIQNVCKGATFGRRLREKRFAPQPRSQNPRHISGAVNSTCFCFGRWQQLYLPNLGFANMHCRWSR